MARKSLFRIYYAGLLLTACILLIRGTPGIVDVPWPAVILWVCLMTLTEAAPVRLPGGGVITVSSILDYAGIIVFGPYLTAWIDLFSALTCRAALKNRRPFHKTLFNMALYVVTCVAAGELFKLVGGTVGVIQLPADFPAIIAMGLTYFAVNTLGVSLVISLTGKESLTRVWEVNFRWTIFHLLAFVPFACIVALVYIQLGYLGVLLFMFPILLARYSFKIYTEMRQDFMDFVGTLTSIIEEVDPYTRRHSHRVSQHAKQVARELGLSRKEEETIATAALLHDIGKVSFRTQDIIDSPGQMTQEQRERMARHPVIGAEIVSRIRMLKDAAECVRTHHERVDGTGYPDGLVGDTIPIGARVLMVADALDAMTSDRSYRRAFPLDVAVDELRRQAGVQFDPQVVSAVERLYHRGELTINRVPEEAQDEIRAAIGAGEE